MPFLVMEIKYIQYSRSKADADAQFIRQILDVAYSHCEPQTEPSFRDILIVFQIQAKELQISNIKDTIVYRTLLQMSGMTKIQSTRINSYVSFNETNHVSSTLNWYQKLDQSYQSLYYTYLLRAFREDSLKQISFFKLLQAFNFNRQKNLVKLQQSKQFQNTQIRIKDRRLNQKDRLDDVSNSSSETSSLSKQDNPPKYDEKMDNMIRLLQDVQKNDYINKRQEHSHHSVDVDSNSFQEDKDQIIELRSISPVNVKNVDEPSSLDDSVVSVLKKINLNKDQITSQIPNDSEQIDQGVQNIVQSLEQEKHFTLSEHRISKDSSISCKETKNILNIQISNLPSSMDQGSSMNSIERFLQLDASKPQVFVSDQSLLNQFQVTQQNTIEDSNCPVEKEKYTFSQPKQANQSSFKDCEQNNFVNSEWNSNEKVQSKNLDHQQFVNILPKDGDNSSLFNLSSVPIATLRQQQRIRSTNQIIHAHSTNSGNQSELNQASSCPIQNNFLSKSNDRESSELISNEEVKTKKKLQIFSHINDVSARSSQSNIGSTCVSQPDLKQKEQDKMMVQVLLNPYQNNDTLNRVLEDLDKLVAPPVTKKEERITEYQQNYLRHQLIEITIRHRDNLIRNFLYDWLNTVNYLQKLKQIFQKRQNQANLTDYFNFWQTLKNQKCKLRSLAKKFLYHRRNQLCIRVLNALIKAHQKTINAKLQRYIHPVSFNHFICNQIDNHENRESIDKELISNQLRLVEARSRFDKLQRDKELYSQSKIKYYSELQTVIHNENIVLDQINQFATSQDQLQAKLNCQIQHNIQMSIISKDKYPVVDKLLCFAEKFLSLQKIRVFMLSRNISTVINNMQIAVHQGLSTIYTKYKGKQLDNSSLSTDTFIGPSVVSFSEIQATFPEKTIHQIAQRIIFKYIQDVIVPNGYQLIPASINTLRRQVDYQNFIFASYQLQNLYKKMFIEYLKFNRDYERYRIEHFKIKQLLRKIRSVYQFRQKMKDENHFISDYRIFMIQKRAFYNLRNEKIERDYINDFCARKTKLLLRRAYSCLQYYYLEKYYSSDLLLQKVNLFCSQSLLGKVFQVLQNKYLKLQQMNDTAVIYRNQSQMHLSLINLVRGLKIVRFQRGLLYKLRIKAGNAFLAQLKQKYSLVTAEEVIYQKRVNKYLKHGFQAIQFKYNRLFNVQYLLLNRYFGYLENRAFYLIVDLYNDLIRKDNLIASRQYVRIATAVFDALQNISSLTYRLHEFQIAKRRKLFTQCFFSWRIQAVTKNNFLMNKLAVVQFKRSFNCQKFWFKIMFYYKQLQSSLRFRQFKRILKIFKHWRIITQEQVKFLRFKYGLGQKIEQIQQQPLYQMQVGCEKQLYFMTKNFKLKYSLNIGIMHYTSIIAVETVLSKFQRQIYYIRFCFYRLLLNRNTSKSLNFIVNQKISKKNTSVQASTFQSWRYINRMKLSSVYLQNKIKLLYLQVVFQNLKSKYETLNICYQKLSCSSQRQLKAKVLAIIKFGKNVLGYKEKLVSQLHQNNLFRKVMNELQQKKAKYQENLVKSIQYKYIKEIKLFFTQWQNKTMKKQNMFRLFNAINKVQNNYVLKRYSRIWRLCTNFQIIMKYDTARRIKNALNIWNAKARSIQFLQHIANTRVKMIIFQKMRNVFNNDKILRSNYYKLIYLSNQQCLKYYLSLWRVANLNILAGRRVASNHKLLLLQRAFESIKLTNQCNKNFRLIQYKHQHVLKSIFFSAIKRIIHNLKISKIHELNRNVNLKHQSFAAIRVKITQTQQNFIKISEKHKLLISQKVFSIFLLQKQKYQIQLATALDFRLTQRANNFVVVFRALRQFHDYLKQNEIVIQTRHQNILLRNVFACIVLRQREFFECQVKCWQISNKNLKLSAMRALRHSLNKTAQIGLLLEVQHTQRLKHATFQCLLKKFIVSLENKARLSSIGKRILEKHAIKTQRLVFYNLVLAKRAAEIRTQLLSAKYLLKWLDYSQKLSKQLQKVQQLRMANSLHEQFQQRRFRAIFTDWKQKQRTIKLWEKKADKHFLKRVIKQWSDLL